MNQNDLQSLAKAISHTDWRSNVEELESLTNRWRATKAALTAAQDAHLQSEVELYNAVKDQLPAKGTTTLESGIRIVTGFKEAWDQDGIDRAYQAWDGTLKFPFKTEWKPDGKALTYIRENAPQHWKQIQDALTITEKKPAFSFNDKE